MSAPATLPLADASTLPCAGVTAWFGLVERGSVHAGEIVVVEGTGGVSFFAIQIAKAHGAQVIVSGSAGKLDRAVALGADHVVDRQRPDLVEAIYELTHDHGVDHVVEIVGGKHLGEAVRVAAVGGTIYQIGALEGFDISAPAMPLMLKGNIIQGIGTGHRRSLERLVDAVDRTALKPAIDSSYPLADLPAAIDQLERGPFGKIVVDLAA